ncbi:hypothetical protein ASF92_16110 [Pedobacter sp. Leaf176]|nr:hypothetical protein ASF92_16110 [Pedobacter sp. Leaf176]
MQDTNRHLEILQAQAAGTDPITGEVFPADSPYNQPEIIRALFFAINQLEALAEKGNQGLAWVKKMNCLQNALVMAPRLPSLPNYILAPTEPLKPG